MHSDLAELGDLVEFLDSQRVPVEESLRKHGPYPYYGANGQQGWVDDYIFDEPLVLLAEDGGHFGSKEKPIAYYVEGKCWVNNHAHVLRTKQGCDAHYLHHILSFYDVSSYVTGSTRLKLTKSNAESIRIPLPGLPEQKRIAIILERADKLRRTRHYARQLSDTFLQSVFLKMFGNVLKKGTSSVLKDVLAMPLSNGSFEVNEVYGTGTPVVWVDNLYHTISIDVANLRRARLSDQAIQKYAVLEEDLLFTRSSLVREGIGQVNIVPTLLERTAFECHVIRARIDKEQINPFYVLGLYRSQYGRRAIMQRANTATMTTISQTAIEELPCPVPPLPAQERFAASVQRLERLQVLQNEAERQAEHLFQTLLNRAFAGELVEVAKSRSVKRKPSVPAQKRTYSPGIFYRRAAIEAYVINALRGDPYLGRTKLEKIDHLIEYHCGIDLERYPVRDAAGPDDYLSRMKLEHLANKRNWFSAHDKKDGSIVKYLPKRGFMSAALKGAQEIGEKRNAVDNLLKLMRPFDTKRCEIIATLYAAWNDFLLAGKTPSDAEIVRDVLHDWRPEKQLIPERRWLRGLKWMRENGLVPRGQGKPVLNSDKVAM